MEVLFYNSENILQFTYHFSIFHVIRHEKLFWLFCSEV